MNELRYAFRDITNNKVISAFLLILCTIMMILFVNTFAVLSHTRLSIEKVEKYRNTEAYIIQDSTDDLQFEKVYSDDTAISKMENFFCNLRNENITFYTQFGYDMYISEFGNIVRQECVTSNFFELFGIDTIEGRLFTQEEYDVIADVVPVVIGYNLTNEYKVGEIYKFVNAGTGEAFDGKIIGRMKKNSSYMEFNNSFEMMYSLDDSYIIPIGLKDYQNERMSFSDWDMSLTSMVILSDDVEFVENGIEKMNLFKLSLLDIQERFDEVISAETNYLYVVMIITAIIILLVLVVTWIIFSRLIKKQLYEYGIHLLCGAKKGILVKRIACYAYFILFISIFVTCVLLQSVSEFFFLCGLAVCLGALILIYPAGKLKFCNILQLMKNC